MPSRIADSDIVGAPRRVAPVEAARPVLDLRDVARPAPTPRRVPDSGVVGASDLMPRRSSRRRATAVPRATPAELPVAVSIVDQRDALDRVLDIAARTANDNRVRIATLSIVLMLLVFGVFGDAIDRSLTDVIEVAPPTHGNGIG